MYELNKVGGRAHAWELHLDYRRKCAELDSRTQKLDPDRDPNAQLLVHACVYHHPSTATLLESTNRPVRPRVSMPGIGVKKPTPNDRERATRFWSLDPCSGGGH